MSQDEHILPIFPLANVVLFPHVWTPLHIFEPRYRQMTSRALAGDRRIVMTVVLPDRVGEMAGDPPVFPVACAGVIREFRRLPDGRFDIVLHGTERVRILEEPERPRDQLYRSARVRMLEDAYRPDRVDQLAALRERTVALVGELVGADVLREIASAESFAGIDDGAFVNAICNALPLPTPEKQGLLEADGIPERFERLVAVLRFSLAERRARKVPNSGTFH